MRNIYFALCSVLLFGCVSRRVYVRDTQVLEKKYKSLEDNFNGCLTRESGNQAELDMYRKMFAHTMEIQHSVDPTKK